MPSSTSSSSRGPKLAVVFGVVAAWLVLFAIAGEIGHVDDLHTPQTFQGRWAWIRNVTETLEPTHYSHAFIGSSQTINAIDPNVFDAQWGQGESINVGHFRWGHDADFFVVRELLERHRVDELVVEISNRSALPPHEMAKYQIRASDLATELRIFKGGVSATDWLRYSARFKQHAVDLTRAVASATLSWPHLATIGLGERLAGSSPSRGDQEADTAATTEAHHASKGFTIAKRARRQDPAFTATLEAAAPPSPERWHPSETQRLSAEGPYLGLPAPLSRGALYLARLKNLAALHDTRLSFLQIPTYRARPLDQARVAHLADLGDVLIPPLEEFSVGDEYMDRLHLRTHGARRFTLTLVPLLRTRGGSSAMTSRYPVLRDRL